MDNGKEVNAVSTSSNLKSCGEEETASFDELLNFTCRIETLISQLLLLSSRIPPHFLDARYDPILFEIRYFESPSEFEAKIDGNKKLEELEDELGESCSEYMQRLFLLVNGIVVYHQQLFEYLQEGPVGMASLVSLLVKIITENLKLAFKGLKILMDARCLEQIEMLNTALGPPSSLPLLRWSSYQLMAKLPGMLWEPWVESLACIGQLQILRCLINLKLNSACKVKARAVCPALDGIFTLVSSQRDKILIGNDKENCATIEHFLHELSKLEAFCGFSVPLQTTYLTEDPPHFLGRCASMVTISQLPRYVLNTHLGTLTSHVKTVSLDFSPVVIGLGTFLRQFHPSYLMEYVQALKSILWMMFFCKHMEIPKDVVDSCIPPSLIAVLQA